MKYNKFKTLLKKAVKESFSTAIKNNDIYSFAIITSEFTDSIIAVANTTENMNSCKKDYEEATSLGCKYLPEEWDYGIETNNKEFEALNEMLFNEIFIEKSKEKYLSFEKKIFTICINTLRELRDDDFFKVIKKEVFIMFESMDGSFSKTKLKEIVSILNDNKYKKEYFEWIDSID